MNGWNYYNHALVPNCSLQESPNTNALKKRETWNTKNGIAYFARYISDYDCGYETNWWYIIKDTPFCINDLKAKRRYEINKGLRNFYVRVIDNPIEYADDIYGVYKSAVLTYDSVSNIMNKDSYVDAMSNWNKNQLVIAAFHNMTNEMAAWATLIKTDKEINFSQLKANPKYEKDGVNAAIVYSILEYYDDDIRSGYYINDGSRSVYHETAFQDYLEKYFCFRKAYCHLQIKYRFPVNVIVKIIFPFREYISKINHPLAKKVYAILLMEEFRKNDIKQNLSV